MMMILSRLCDIIIFLAVFKLLRLSLTSTHLVHHHACLRFLDTIWFFLLFLAVILSRIRILLPIIAHE